MITLIEIDGFKTFRKFKMEFSPLTVVAGANASGKSNLFDALSLLSRLAETDLRTAFNEQRGEAVELFTQYDDDLYGNTVTFAIEMLVDKKVKDNWGGEATLKYTRLRYELKVKRAKNERGLEELFVEHEKLENLKHNEDKWVKNYIPNKYLDDWRPKVPSGRRTKPYIYTIRDDDNVTIKLPQDGRRGGKETPANAVSQTVLSGINSVDFPHAYAAKEEIKSWKFLQLDPHALRKPSSYLAKDVVTQTGENLAAALHRIKINDPFALKGVSRRLNKLISNFTEVNVENDTANKQFLIKIKSEDGRTFSSRVLSEGTLRLLALCIFQYDDEHKGLLCFEEPENGIHPRRMHSMFELLKDLTVDFSDTNFPLRQVVVNTHSPVLVGEMINYAESSNISIWFSRLVTQIISISEKKIKLQTTKMLPVEKSSQQTLFFSEHEKKLTLAEVKNYLSSVAFETESAYN